MASTVCISSVREIQNSSRKIIIVQSTLLAVTIGLEGGTRLTVTLVRGVSWLLRRGELDGELCLMDLKNTEQFAVRRMVVK